VIISSEKFQYTLHNDNNYTCISYRQKDLCHHVSPVCFYVKYKTRCCCYDWMSAICLYIIYYYYWWLFLLMVTQEFIHYNNNVPRTAIPRRETIYIHLTHTQKNTIAMEWKLKTFSNKEVVPLLLQIRDFSN